MFIRPIQIKYYIYGMKTTLKILEAIDKVLTGLLELIAFLALASAFFYLLFKLTETI